MTSSVTLVSALKRIAAAGGVSEPSGQGQAYVQRCIRAARNDVGCHQLEVPPARPCQGPAKLAPGLSVRTTNGAGTNAPAPIARPSTLLAPMVFPSGPTLCRPTRRHGECAMSLAQIAATDWSLVFGTALGWLLIIIFMVTNIRKLSRLRADFKLLSDEVSHLKIAEERHFMSEINAQKKRAHHAHLEAGQTADLPVVQSPSPHGSLQSLHLRKVDRDAPCRRPPNGIRTFSPRY